MTKEEFVHYEELRDELVERASKILDEKIEPTEWSIEDSIIDGRGVQLNVRTYSRGCTMDLEGHLVTWEELIKDGAVDMLRHSQDVIS